MGTLVKRVKRVMWVMLVTGMVTIAAFAARRLSVSIWERTMHERPPNTL